MKGIPVKRLAQAFRFWKEHYFIPWILYVSRSRRAGLTMRSITATQADPRDLERFILSLRPNSLPSKENLYPFWLMETEGRIPLNEILEDLVWWNVYSRRVYTLTRTLAAALVATKIDTLRWSAIHFPFKCFALQLDHPLADSRGEAYDFLMVRVEDRQLVVSMYFKSLEQQSILPDNRKDRLLRLAESGRLGSNSPEWIAATTQAESQAKGTFCYVARLPLGGPDELIVDSLRRYHQAGQRNISYGGRSIVDPAEGGTNEFDLALYLTFAFCLCLQTRATSVSSRRRKGLQLTFEDQEGLPKPQTFTDASAVCHVGTTIEYDPRQIEIIEALGGAASTGRSPHFRHGHLRRPWGSYVNFDIPKITWVSPTFVNLARLLEGTLPLGAKGKL